MTPKPSTAEQQLNNWIENRVAAWDPFNQLPLPDEPAVVAKNVTDRLKENDTKIAFSLMRLMWPAGWPTTINRAEWWATPLGKLTAAAIASSPDELDDRPVTHSQAAAMLGVTKGTIAQHTHRGTLTPNPTTRQLTRNQILNQIKKRHTHHQTN